MCLERPQPIWHTTEVQWPLQQFLLFIIPSNCRLAGGLWAPDTLSSSALSSWVEWARWFALPSEWLGRWKTTACWGDRCLAWMSLWHFSAKLGRGWNSSHHSRSQLSFFRQVLILRPVLLGWTLIPSQDFPLFKEAEWWGAMEVTGEVVHLANSMNLVLFTCWGAGPGVSEILSPSPRRAASSSGVGEGPGSSSTSPNREASITSSPLMVINGAMHIGTLAWL